MYAKVGDQMKLIKKLHETKIIAIIRGLEGQVLDQTVQALIAGGIRFVEVTMNTPGAAQSIARLVERHGERIHIGAGTVLNTTEAREAIRAGATYLISPNVEPSVIEYACEQGVEMWPGAITPTEIMQAIAAGATAVKVFPISFYGPEYIEALRGPFDQIPLIAVGGVKVEQFHQYLAAGAVAVGLGNHLIDQQLIVSRQFTQLTARAEKFVKKMQTW